MYLESLELNGFKSFPDKISLDFDKGLTCVVGPNGSGKSNIGDAVRWVLGEQSSKSLRGSNMQDIIFSGTQTRKAGKFAQVTLNIENSDRALEYDADKVSVSRKLYANGDSEYIINGEQVRLKDVLELFMDTGLGRDGYSIIGQGKIADIVSSKSTERREIFEEAAGISKFRYKKAESERKLSHAQDNILRLNDILAELEARVGPLKTQSEKAKKYLDLRDAKKDLDVSLSVCKLNDLNGKLQGLEDKLLVAESEFEALSRELDEIDESVDEGNLERAKCNEIIDSLREHINSAQREYGELNAKTAVLQNDIDHINSSIVDDTLSLKDIDENENSFKGIYDAKEAELSEIRKQIESLYQRIQSTQEQLEGVESRESEFDKNIQNSSNSINELYIRKSELNFTVTNERSNISEYKRQISEGKKYVRDAEDAQKSIARERAEINAACASVDEKLSEYQNRISGFTKLYESKKSQLDSKSDELNALRLKIGELKNRSLILRDLENSMEGFASSVKHIIKASSVGRISGIYGSVAQLISVDPKFSIAIETALGAAMQNIVVENEDTAKRCIRHLKEINGGRATFLPLTSIRPRELNDTGFSKAQGFVAVAADLVEYDIKFKNIMLNLMGKIVVAEDLDSAAIIAKNSRFAFKIVTLDGQVINAGGSFTGGSSSRSAGILTRKNEIDKLDVQIQSSEDKSKQLILQIESLKAETTKLEFDIDSERELQSEHKSDKVRFEAELNRLSDLAKQYDKRLDEADSQLGSLEQKINKSTQAIADAEEELKKADESIKKAESAAALSQSQLEGFKQRREELSKALSDLKIEEISLEKDEQSVIAAIEQLSDAQRDSNNARVKLELHIIEQKKSIDDKKSEIEAISKKISDNENSVKSAQDEIKAQQSRYMSLEAKASKLRSYQKNKMNDKENVLIELERSKEKKSAVLSDIEKILSSLFEEYELTKSEASALAKPIENISEANRELNSIKNKIRALGAVNVNAIEEYKEVSKRYEFLSSQLKDVLKSKSELEKLIADLTEEMIAIFKESFTQINNNFKVIFSELFGGGSGELVLTDPENILESGIEIKVAPPGKVIKNLLSLSGGEQAFVAIAIYFSILMVKPSPFCILDEIEAALDDVNVTKYAQYLRRFTEQTQFILISHRRGTMEEADVLYGVTMQEKGVSKLLKLDAGQTQIDME